MRQRSPGAGSRSHSLALQHALLPQHEDLHLVLVVLGLGSRMLHAVGLAQAAWRPVAQALQRARPAHVQADHARARAVQRPLPMHPPLHRHLCQHDVDLPLHERR